VQLAARLIETRRELAAARGVEARAEGAVMLADLEAPLAAQTELRGASETRHYLTTRGLSVLVGRGAQENHQLTFSVARPEDLWLHARDVPGAHVIVRDNEGRAAAEDMREAAELAAFFSDARQEARVDVHVTRRKHVRPAKGGPGRVQVFHSDTIRVTPRNPEGRLRRR
jgi:predicted ribosome quality control (RQC) complex YloA/Tae2 family protein